MKNAQENNEKQARISAFRTLKDKIATLISENEAVKQENEAVKQENETLRQTVLSLESATPDYEAIASDPQFIERYATASELLNAKIIENYLKGLSAKRGVSVLSTGVGATPLTPHRKPKSLAEAKKLADILIKG